MNRAFLEMHNRISALEQRLAGTIRHAPVAEVNAAEGWVRLDLGEGDDGPLLSPRVPYAQFAGALKIHTPPSVGQNMTMISPTGDYRQAVAMPLTWNDANESPSLSAAENVLTFGDVWIVLTDGGVRIEVGGFTLSLTGGGLAMAGGLIGHNGQNIGSSHRHPGILPGPATTGTPIDGAPTP